MRAGELSGSAGIIRLEKTTVYWFYFAQLAEEFGLPFFLRSRLSRSYWWVFLKACS